MKKFICELVGYLVIVGGLFALALAYFDVLVK